MKMAFGGTIAVALIFMCSVRAVNMAPPPAYAPAPGPAESNSSSDYEYYLVKSDGVYKSLGYRSSSCMHHLKLIFNSRTGQFLESSIKQL